MARSPIRPTMVPMARPKVDRSSVGHTFRPTILIRQAATPMPPAKPPIIEKFPDTLTSSLRSTPLSTHSAGMVSQRAPSSDPTSAQVSTD